MIGRSAGLVAVGWLGLVVGVVPLRAHAASSAGCAAWRGEPSPLPSTAAADPIAARWARLRATELARAAGQLVRANPAAAHALYVHAVCLAPDDTRLVAGARHTRLLRWHRPAVVAGTAAGPPSPASDLARALAQLDGPVRIVPPPPEPEAQASPFVAAQRELAKARDLVRAARFEEALAALAPLRERLAKVPAGHEVSTLRAQLEVLAGTAEVALGREPAAVASFRRALAEEPALELDPRATSPKVVRVFEAARRASHVSEAQP